MDSGKLKEALPYYEMVMEKIVFKGRQGTCMRSFYPTRIPRVSKKARQ
ncbi:unnamed protein product [Arabidopsis halleri]